jgi:hypothetical protein
VSQRLRGQFNVDCFEAGSEEKLEERRRNKESMNAWIRDAIPGVGIPSRRYRNVYIGRSADGTAQ